MKSFYRKYNALIVLFLFSILSIVYFAPHVIFHLKTRFIGGGADPTIYIWSFGWFAHTLITHKGLFFSHVVFHPTGINLTRVTVIPGLAYLFAPITLLFGPVFSYNLCAILSPAMMAWAAYFLCRYITSSTLAGVCGGYFFGFSSYVISQNLGHLNLITPGILIPLFVLLVLYRLDSKINALKFVACFTGLLFLLFTIEIEVFATLVFWGMICFFVSMLFFKEKRSDLLHVLKLVILSLFFTILMLSPFFYYFFSAETLSSDFPSQAIDFSNSLLSLVIPIRTFLINTSLRFSDSSEFNGYIGLGGFILFLIYIKQFWHRIETRYLTCITLLLALGSLGPALHISQNVIFNFPWSPLFTKIPLLKAALPCRIGLYTSLAFSVIVAVWVKESRWALKYRMLIIFTAFVFLFPTFSERHRTTVEAIYIPSFFSNNAYQKYIVKNDNVILMPYLFGPDMLWQAQTNFGFNLAGGFLGAAPSNYSSDLVFGALSQKTPGKITSNDLTQFIQKHHVTKIILLNTHDYNEWLKSRHFKMELDMGDYSPWEKVIAPLCDKPIYAGGMIVYTVHHQG